MFLLDCAEPAATVAPAIPLTTKAGAAAAGMLTPNRGGLPSAAATPARGAASAQLPLARACQLLAGSVQAAATPHKVMQGDTACPPPPSSNFSFLSVVQLLSSFLRRSRPCSDYVFVWP